jgi:hypothetical protein
MDLPPVPWTVVSSSFGMRFVQPNVWSAGVIEYVRGPYIATGEITTLKHEVGNNTVEGRILIAEALLAGAESSEVLGGLGDVFVVEDKVDAAGLVCQGVNLCREETMRGRREMGFSMIARRGGIIMHSREYSWQGSPDVND